jgi:hypothetical protein
MRNKLFTMFAGMCTLAIAVVCAVPAFAQMSEVKEKPRLYSYVGFWSIPRAQWADMEKSLLNILDQFYKSGGSVTPVLNAATKHWDNIFVSRYYNWRPGSYQGAFSGASSYKLKDDAPDDAVDMIAKSLVVPVMEKLLADGTLVEYEIDTEAVHTESPNMFWIVYLANNADGVDKVGAAVRDAVKANGMGYQAFGSMIDWNAHRDYLSRSNATYK